MKLKEKISLETLNENAFNARIVEPGNYNEAVLTHYLYNTKNGVSHF